MKRRIEGAGEGSLPCLANETRRAIDPDDVCFLPAELDGEASDAGSEVDNPLVPQSDTEDLQNFKEAGRVLGLPDRLIECRAGRNGAIGRCSSLVGHPAFLSTLSANR